MPTKHIPAATWKEVERATVDAVAILRKPVKDTDVLNYLILKGLSDIKEQDWRNVEAWELRKDSQE